jgi:hypothetical protein
MGFGMIGEEDLFVNDNFIEGFFYISGEFLTFKNVWFLIFF